jgi:hypothetical protein
VANLQKSSGSLTDYVLIVFWILGTMEIEKGRNKACFLRLLGLHSRKIGVFLWGFL